MTWSGFSKRGRGGRGGFSSFSAAIASQRGDERRTIGNYPRGKRMPSVSPPQKKLMRIAAHTPGGFGGVPQSVGKEFFAADQAKKHNKGGAIEPVSSKRVAPAPKQGWRRW